MNNQTQAPKDAAQTKSEPVMSIRTKDGTLVETIMKREEGMTRFVAARDGTITERASLSLDGRQFVPYSPRNNLLTHRVIVLPSAVADYGTEIALADEVRAFIHRYVDLTPGFEEIAAHYVLLTWGYDVFNELPYLRVRGDYGSGKSRFLLTVGALCYKPIFASGASTVSPIFRLLDHIGGTLVVDEADFRASDERAEIVKILNNGNAKGFPVLRSEVTPSKEFNPRAFNIFGPKLVATRHRFEDEALESRCLTEVLGERPVRPDIPQSLPRCFEEEAEAIRNKLLSYRFRTFSAWSEKHIESEPGLTARRGQILAPLLSVAATDDARERIRMFMKGDTLERGAREVLEERVLRTVKMLLTDASAPVSLGAIARKFDEEWRSVYQIEMSPRSIGAVLRQMGVCPEKSNGVYVVPAVQYPRLRELFVAHGLGDIRDDGDEQAA